MPFCVVSTSGPSAPSLGLSGKYEQPQAMGARPLKRPVPCPAVGATATRPASLLSRRRTAPCPRSAGAVARPGAQGARSARRPAVARPVARATLVCGRIVWAQRHAAGAAQTARGATTPSGITPWHGLGEAASSADSGVWRVWSECVSPDC